MTKKKGLGKGLAALIPVQESGGEQPVQTGAYCYVDLQQIKPNPNQPREKIDKQKLQELMESIKTHGLIQPIIVRPRDNDGYEIIAGERRWRACAKLNMKQVPVLIKTYDDLEASAVALIENIQREDLNAVEEARGYKQLMSEYGLTQEELSTRVGKSRPFIANMVRLLTLPTEIKEMLAEGIISAGHARALLPLEDSENQIKFTLQIIKRQLSVRKTEELVKRHLEQKKETRQNLGEQKKAMGPDQESLLWVKKLTATIGKPVKIMNNADGSGKLVISYHNHHDLAQIMKKLKIN